MRLKKMCLFRRIFIHGGEIETHELEIVFRGTEQQLKEIQKKMLELI